MKNLELENELYVKATIYGPSGTGKTSLAATAPKPMVLLSERQGLVHLRESAARNGVDCPQALLMESMEDYRAVFRACNGDPTKPFLVVSDEGEVIYQGDWPETLIVDSLTDACRLIVADIRKKSPPKDGKDGLPVDSDRFWNVLGDKCQNLILSFRNAPMHVLFLALNDDRMVGEENPVRQVTPDLPMRKLANFLTGACNVVGYSYRYERNVSGQAPEQKYALLLSGPEYFLLKRCNQLRAKEPPSFQRIIDGAIKGLVATGEDEAQPVATLADMDEVAPKLGPQPAAPRKRGTNAAV